MSSARVAVIGTFIEAWNRRDSEPMLEAAGDDFEYVNAPDALEPGTRRGRDGIREVMRKQWEALGDARQEITRVHDQGDRVITEGWLSRSMPGSTSRIENKVVLGWDFDGDRLIRLEVLGAGSSYHEALAKAGIGEG